MEYFDIDKLLGENLEAGHCRNEFKEELFTRSANALVTSALMRRRIKIAGTFLVICMVAAGAFVCGRFSAGRQSLNIIPGQSYAAKNTIEGFAGFASGAEDGFWKTKMMASLQTRPSHPSKTYESNANLLEKYRQYIRQKH